MHDRYQNKMLRTDDGRTFEDKHIRCVECGCEFIYSVSDQIFYEKMKFIEPKRCKQCRETRKHKLNQE